VAAGGRLLKYSVENAENVRGLKADLVDAWPLDKKVLEAASTVVFIGDIFPPVRFDDSSRVMRELATMMDRGCGIVCVHYATGLRADDVAEDGDHPLLHWMGGYFATRNRHHQSVARVFEATIEPGQRDHPVTRGWQKFTLRDEPYYNNYFGKKGPAPNVVALAVSQLPPENPKREIVAWGIERRDGGRGMGIVMPHFFESWQVDDLRKLILNGIVWTARLEVPEKGVETKLPDLATFQPAAVEFKPQPKR
jgi:type 1 glutamine amidotransferase